MSRWDATRQDALLDYMQHTKRQLNEHLEDYSAHFRLRALGAAAKLVQTP